jgi:hypothetical protein
MQYVQVRIGKLLIDFHNSWLGEESVYVNGKLVSKKSSVLGTDHHFTRQEDGEEVHYVLTSRIDSPTGVALDLRRNGRPVKQGISVPYGFKPRKPRNPDRKKGLDLLAEYDIAAAKEHLKNALQIDANDPEVHLALACCYSIEENASQAFAALQKAVDCELTDPNRILTHDQLAFVRLHPAFEAFHASQYRRLDPELLRETPEDSSRSKV